MNSVLEKWIEELRTIPGIGTTPDEISDLIACEKSEELLRAYTWIVAQPRSIVERLDATRKLLALPPGRIEVSLCELTGWKK